MIFAIACAPDCPYEPDDGFRHVTMPTVGDNLTAWPQIYCDCGLAVYLVHEVADSA